MHRNEQQQGTSISPFSQVSWGFFKVKEKDIFLPEIPEPRNGRLSFWLKFPTG
jgi:hypothetical protein